MLRQVLALNVDARAWRVLWRGAAGDELPLEEAAAEAHRNQGGGRVSKGFVEGLFVRFMLGEFLAQVRAGRRLRRPLGLRRRLPPKHLDIYSRELPLGSQSHSRISSLCVCARVPFVL